MQTSNVSCCVRSSTEFLLVCSFDATDMNDTILTLSMYEHLNKEVLRDFLKMSVLVRVCLCVYLCVVFTLRVS